LALPHPLRNFQIKEFFQFWGSRKSIPAATPNNALGELAGSILLASL